MWIWFPLKSCLKAFTRKNLLFNTFIVYYISVCYNFFQGMCILSEIYMIAHLQGIEIDSFYKMNHLFIAIL